VSPASIATRAADFRNAFDKAFAQPRVTGNEAAWEDFLTIRITGDGYALRLREIAGLVKGRRVVPCPGDVPEFQGIAGVRGTLVSVYSLPALLGYSTGPEQAAWLLLCGAEGMAGTGDEAVGLAFAEFSGFVRALQSQIHTARDSEAPSSQSVRSAEFLRIGGEVRTIVSIPRVLSRCFDHAARTPAAGITELTRTSEWR
jgi:chemotaxis signal transduction protein